MRRYFDNTMLKDYKDCPRRYFLRHVRKWRRDGTAAPLVFGLSWHAAMDILWSRYGSVSDEALLELATDAFTQCWAEAGMPLPLSLNDIVQLEPRTPFVAREMLAGYLTARRHVLDNMRLVACEQPFAVPLPMDKLGVHEAWYCGRLDKVFDYSNLRIVAEHKSTTEYKIDGGFKTSYLEGWYLDSQILGYLFGGGLFFSGLEQVWVDAALVHKKVHSAFKFIPIGHQWSMLETWVQDTSEWVARIYSDELKFHRAGKLGQGVFPKQTESCQSKYGSCQFLDICRTQPDPSTLDGPPLGYVEEEWSPFSILKLEKLLDTH